MSDYAPLFMYAFVTLDPAEVFSRYIITHTYTHPNTHTHTQTQTHTDTHRHTQTPTGLWIGKITHASASLFKI